MSVSQRKVKNAPTAANGAGAAGGGNGGKGTRKPKLIHSCSACHTRKVACDKARPACTACLRHAKTMNVNPGSIVCHYAVDEIPGRAPKRPASGPPFAEVQQRKRSFEPINERDLESATTATKTTRRHSNQSEESNHSIDSVISYSAPSFVNDSLISNLPTPSSGRPSPPSSRPSYSLRRRSTHQSYGPLPSPSFAESNLRAFEDSLESTSLGFGGISNDLTSFTQSAAQFHLAPPPSLYRDQPQPQLETPKPSRLGRTKDEARAPSSAEPMGKLVYTPYNFLANGPQHHQQPSQSQLDVDALVNAGHYLPDYAFFSKPNDVPTFTSTSGGANFYY